MSAIRWAAAEPPRTAATPNNWTVTAVTVALIAATPAPDAVQYGWLHADQTYTMVLA